MREYKGYGSQRHIDACRTHAKKRAEQRLDGKFNRAFRRRAIMEIKNRKSVALDSRCSTDPNRSLHWVFLDDEWHLLVYWALKEEIVTVLPKRSSVPYSPISLKKLQQEAMWASMKKTA